MNINMNMNMNTYIYISTMVYSLSKTIANQLG